MSTIREHGGAEKYMAASGGVAQRYARAIYEIAEEEQDLDGWLRDLVVIRDVLTEPTIVALLNNPEVSFDEKAGVSDASLKGLPVERQNLVKLLIQNHRTNTIDRIVVAYEHLVNQKRGIVRAVVATAVPLDAAELDNIAKRLGQSIDRTVVVSATVDPAIIGGFVARIGDRLIDGSVAGRLAAMRSNLIS